MKHGERPVDINRILARLKTPTLTIEMETNENVADLKTPACANEMETNGIVADFKETATFSSEMETGGRGLN